MLPDPLRLEFVVVESRLHHCVPIGWTVVEDAVCGGEYELGPTGSRESSAKIPGYTQRFWKQNPRLLASSIPPRLQIAQMTDAHRFERVRVDLAAIPVLTSYEPKKARCQHFALSFRYSTRLLFRDVNLTVAQRQHETDSWEVRSFARFRITAY